MDRSSALARKLNEAMGQDILDREEDSPLTPLKIERICKIIQKLPRKEKLADVGCFDGKFFEAYRSCGVSSIDGFDILPKALEIAAKRDAGASTILWDFESERSPAEDSSYDIIVCSDVIEHLFDPNNLVSECHRILRVSGTCIFLTPNLTSLWNRYLMLLGRMPLGHPGVASCVRTEEQVNLAHSRIGTAKEWIGLLQANGLKVSSVDGVWSSGLSKLLSLGRATLAHTLVIVCSK